MNCCRAKEPIPKIKERVCAVLFWGAIALFVLLYMILLDMAVEANKGHGDSDKPVNLGHIFQDSVSSILT